jgi:excisionase family DNA binding protein
MHMFRCEVPIENGDGRQAIAVCNVAVSLSATTRDWDEVTCRSCVIRKRISEAARATRLNRRANRTNCAELEVIVRVADEKEVLTLEEAALVLRCSKAHVQNIVRGRVPNVFPLPSIRIGRRVVIRRASLERWMAAVEEAD